ncbi:cadherin domain-containing protein, partial [Pontibacterium sp.]|uniref:cadherin domain-containing protein n=1 Tax=Pontibacterium sp. TaxID=2036026 RepID=UPI0035653815
IQIVATGTVSYTRSQTFVITLTDDQAPTSLRDTNAAGDVGEIEHGTVLEGAAADTEVGITVQADDTASILYSLQTGTSSDLFDIDPDSGVISVATGAAINFETSVLHSLTVVATDAFGNAETFTVNISVVNGAPVLQDDAAEATERANNLTGNVLSNDADPGSAAGADLTVATIRGFSAIHAPGQAAEGSDGGLFTVNEDGSWSFNANGDFDELTDGEIRTTHVTLDVRDSSGEGGTTQLEITVTGISAEAPEVVFSTTEIDQSLRRNSEAARLSIANPGPGQSFTYSLVDGAGSNSNNLFTLENGILRVVDDAANLTLGELTIRVRTELVGDDPNGQYTIEQTYALTVVDTVAPQFRGDSDRMGDGSDVNGRVVPGMANDATVGITVEMDRADQGNVTFSLSSGGDRFQIDADSGIVSIKDASLISASDSLYTITVVATDLAGNNTSRDYNIQVNAVIGAAVDDTDRTTQGYERSGDVLRNDRDADGNNDALTVDQVNGSADNLNTAVAGSNGGLFTIAADGSWTFDPTDALNKVKQNESLDTAIEVSVRDSMGLLSTSTLTMTVLGRNDAPTNLQLSSVEYTLSAVNRVVGDLTVEDVDEGDTHTFRISRDNSRSFEVVGNQLLVKEDVSLTPGSYTLTLEASDSGRARAIQEFTIVIADDGAPTFATPADSDSAGNDGEAIQGAVNDGATEGTVGITASATDSSQITYLLADDASGRFVIDGASGVISVKQGATILLGDAFYDVTVRATDVYDNSA